MRIIFKKQQKKTLTVFFYIFTRGDVVLCVVGAVVVVGDSQNTYNF